MTEGQALLVVQVAVDPAQEAEWNRWYDEIHLPEIATCPGFLRGSRYVSEDEHGRQYLTVYALESEAALSSAEFAARRGWAQFAPHVRPTVRCFRHLITVENPDVATK